MTPEQFTTKWRGCTRTERSASQEHFLDLCVLIGVPTPQEEDKHGGFYTFEKSVLKLGGRPGRADVWRKGRFAWEYKGPKKNLTAAYAQLKEYSDALENPPLLIVSDMSEIRIHTNFTNSIAVQHTIALADLISVEARQRLFWCFTDPEKLRPNVTRETVTREAAKTFGSIASKLRIQGYEPRRVAHFLNRLVFCLFAEDIGLLPNRLFADILEESVKSSEGFQPMLCDLFRSMKDKGGRFGTVSIPWFNGGLFDDDDVLPLGWSEIKDLLDASRLDWSAIEPSIFGTLLEAGLDPEKRDIMASLFDPGSRSTKRTGAADKGVGIHYTDPTTIMKIIEPVVMAPLRQAWENAKARILQHRAAQDRTKFGPARTAAEHKARAVWTEFRETLAAFRVLDPACGSGNFLYFALIQLKNFDLEVLTEGQGMGLPLDSQRVTPLAVMGIEANPYAAELARVTVWIGELQWQMRNAFDYLIKRIPVLGRLDAIECRDALLNADWSEADWPPADVVVGNPPFLGGKRLRNKLRDEYVDHLFATYSGRIPAEADLVVYWIVKAWERVKDGRLKAAGLVATNSVRGGVNRRVLEPMASSGAIYDAWADEPWVVDGAAVRVSLFAFMRPPHNNRICLDGTTVDRINPDLTATKSDLTTARPLLTNIGVAFMGDTKGGAFDVPPELAREWLALPLNPNGRPNADVLKPWRNGMDLTRRSADKWIIDFGWEMDERAAAMYEAPFAYVMERVKPVRSANRRDHYRTFWWRHVEPRPGMWSVLSTLRRYIASPTVAKHRLMVWLDGRVCPDHQLIAIARDDDTSFGILHSRFHEIWALRLGTSLEDRPRYTPSTAFETFPFPDGLGLNLQATSYIDDPHARAIGEAAHRLDELRQAWLNPPDLVRIEPEIAPGLPDRIVPNGKEAAIELQVRTLTSLYNKRPTWLTNAHRDLVS